MDKKEKFERTVIILMVIALWMLAALNSYIPEKAEPADEHEGILRFHVIANSDSARDQELKLGLCTPENRKGDHKPDDRSRCGLRHRRRICRAQS